jgi:hypothetical protein
MRRIARDYGVFADSGKLICRRLEWNEKVSSHCGPPIATTGMSAFFRVNEAV